MKDEEGRNRQTWQTPEIYDLAVYKTAGKEWTDPMESGFFGAS